MVRKFLQGVKTGEINIVEYIKKALRSCHSINEEYHYFSVICEQEALEQARDIQKKIAQGNAGKLGKLAGLPVSVKDNICVKGVESTAGSSILKGYRPVFDATVIEHLKKEDAIIIGKTVMDEFGFGSFCLNMGKGIPTPLNPHDKTRSAGGSSGGAGGFTAKADFVHVALGESTGGSIENPASYCGVVGFCPTYGRVSRWGLISYANSLDKIGLLSKKAEDLLPVLEVIAGPDGKDATAVQEKLPVPEQLLVQEQLGKKQPTGKTWKAGIIKESMEGLDSNVKNASLAFVEKLRNKGIEVVEISLPFTFQYCVAAYYIIALSESSTNLAKFCGLRYGVEGKPQGKTFDQYFTEMRSRHFNEESKRRIILGTFARMAGYRDAFYLKAAKVRKKIIEEHREHFKAVDILLSPTMPTAAPKFSDLTKLTPLQVYMMDILNLGLNLAGLPHASFPIARKKKELPIGMTASADQREEGKLLEFLEIVEGLGGGD